MYNLHRCYTFYTGVTLFALMLHLDCTVLSQSESNNFFMYTINKYAKLNHVNHYIMRRKLIRA